MNANGKWVRITHSRNIPLREGRSVNVAGHQIAIFNLGDRFVAVDNRCPHGGGPLSDGIVSGPTVVCPLHAWRVNLETGSVSSPGGARPCLATFPTRVEEDVVLVELPAGPTAEPAEPLVCVAHPGPAKWLGAKAPAGP